MLIQGIITIAITNVRSCPIRNTILTIVKRLFLLGNTGRHELLFWEGGCAVGIAVVVVLISCNSTFLNDYLGIEIVVFFMLRCYLKIEVIVFLT